MRASLALFGFNRPAHTRNCLESLTRNPEAAESHLYCFLDGPRTQEDVANVESVRRILRGATGFAGVDILERQGNWGLSRNIIDGITRTLQERERVIVVEDDLEVSPGFLAYMNRALVAYRGSPAVFSVSAYNYPRTLLRVPASYPYDAFFVTRHMCWGWATWRDRWARADWQLNDYESLQAEESWRRSFGEAGLDLPGMLEAQHKGQIDSWAIRWTHAHFANHAVCLVPVQSFVNNLGTDGSGTHMRPSGRYFHDELHGRESIRLPPIVYVDPLIARRFKSAERRNLAVRVAAHLRKEARHLRQTGLRRLGAGLSRLGFSRLGIGARAAGQTGGTDPVQIRSHSH